MSTSSIGPSYDPASTASALAQKYTSGLQSILTAQTQQASAVGKGLNDLDSALSTFQASLLGLTGVNKTMAAQSATFSDTAFGTASASSTAAAGSYAFFVEQIATASQMSYSGLTEDAGVTGNLKINMNGALAFSVDLGAAGVDADGNGKLSPRELAAAINAAAGNTSLVTASIVTTGATTSELVLTAKNTGAAGRITLDTSAISKPLPGTASLVTANSAPNELVVAQDAVIRVGSSTGTAITQATNTFTNVAGVTMTFTKAQATGATPVTLTVAADSGATTANVQAFVDAYNKLKSAIDGLVDPGDPAKGKAGGAFAHDGGVRALRDRLVALVRPNAGSGGSPSLAAFGIIAARDGTLELRSARLTSQLALDPTGLDKLIGSSGASASGIAGAMDSYLKEWNNSSNGKIKSRKEDNSKDQGDMTVRQTRIDQQYDAAYKRYLLQFTKLQIMQSQMSSNVSMFDAMFGNKTQ
jgi:flagellar hook-associated protein 2